jgi:hypothetical protein
MGVDEEDAILVPRRGRHSFAEIRAALFPEGPPEPKSLEELKAGIECHVATRHARVGGAQPEGLPEA